MTRAGETCTILWLCQSSDMFHAPPSNMITQEDFVTVLLKLLQLSSMKKVMWGIAGTASVSSACLSFMHWQLQCTAPEVTYAAKMDSRQHCRTKR